MKLYFVPITIYCIENELQSLKVKLIYTCIFEVQTLKRELLMQNEKNTCFVSWCRGYLKKYL